MKKIGLYPGCFDPFHRQHQTIVEKTLQQFGLDEIWILINQTSQEKDIIASFSNRFQMIYQLFAHQSRIKIWPKAISYYTTFLVQQLQKQFPEITFYLILGSDQVNNLEMWTHAQILHRLVKIICAPRLGYPLQPALVDKYSVLFLNNLVMNNFNSRSIKQGYNWHFLAPSTKEYICTKHLYFDNVLQHHLSNDQKRRQHSLAVAKLAVQLSKRFGFRFHEKSFLYMGALFHDLSKNWTEQQHLSFWKRHKLDLNLLKTTPRPIWHAYTSAYFVSKEMQITNENVFYGIFYHTTGSIKLNTFGQIIFIADKLEPHKMIKEFDEVRNLLKKHSISFAQIFSATVVAVYEKITDSKLVPTASLKQLYQKVLKTV